MVTDSEPGTRTVADLIVDRVAAHTDHLFGVGGANIEDLYDAVHRHPALIGIIAKHEFGAATMADGYARATNRLGVVAATSGGGAMNLFAALTESFDSRTPILALVGQPPTALEGRGAFQDTSGLPGRLDAEAIFGAVSRHCAKVTRPQDISAELTRAIDAALTGGPAILLLPKDIQAAPAATVATPSSAVATPSHDTGTAESTELPVQLADLLAEVPASGRVVVIAGPEVAASDARAALAAVVRSWHAAVLVTPDAKDAFPNRDSRFAGVVGVMGHPHAPELVAGSELCLLVGAPMSMTARAGLDGALAACPRVAYLGSEDPFVPVGAVARGPLATTLRAVADLAGARDRLAPPWTESAEIGSRITELPVPPSAGPGVRYRAAVGALEAALEPGTDVIVDAGNTGAAVVHHLRVPEEGRFLIALGMGGMGYSFGAGIGCALGRGRRAVVIAGDGAYFMHGHEVHTAVEYGVDVTFVVFNNNAHAMCVTREQVFYSGAYSFNRFRAAEIGAGVAAMFPELPAWTARTVTEFENALEKTRAIPGPAFIELQCDPDEFPPFAPFLKEPLP
ncbi:thiamine pyrophosphate-binding protein [Nocardia seriolae]|nr:thiamine pyrophosphate-binding protein [Nocardia seriolae]MTJ74242.1 thiamine pyrophosphate-binding protein [Nocardia seriolae]MTJ91198.1 thiamine pyrophosphate-binding protein [Nocardia seriolae]MTK39356.1 thiamine pyrophosphate-binding protein [Nocardia seriolae]MTK51775.1 thiamine pyrophosphate-binding protein [Nocardia seriolae]